MGQEIRRILFQSCMATGPSITSEPPEKYFYVQKTLCMIDILSHFFRRVKDGEKNPTLYELNMPGPVLVCGKHICHSVIFQPPPTTRLTQ